MFFNRISKYRPKEKSDFPSVIDANRQQELFSPGKDGTIKYRYFGKNDKIKLSIVHNACRHPGLFCIVRSDITAHRSPGDITSSDTKAVVAVIKSGQIEPDIHL